MLFDPRTLAAAAAFFLLLLAGLNLIISRSQKTYPGFGRWTAANALVGLGMLIVAFQPHSSNFVNVLFIAGMISATEGNRAFRRLNPRLWWLYAAGAAAVIGAAYSESMQNPNGRQISMAACHFLTSSVSAKALLTRPP